MASLLLVADAVWPIAAPALRDGGVLVQDGAVVAVAPAAALRRAATRELYASGVLLPGMVDAATVVERADEAVAGAPEGWDDERWQRSARHGVHAVVRAGIALAADRVERGPAVPAAGRAGLRGDALVAVDPAAASVDAITAAVAAALDRPAHGRRVGVAVAAGADDGLLRALARLTAARGAPLHLGEAGGHVARLAALGVLGATTRLSGLGPEDEPHLPALARARCAVVLLPRVDARSLDLAALDRAGVPVALGSGGVVPDPLADVAALAAAPAATGGPPDPERLVRLVTADGGRALGRPDAGHLTPGVRADLVGIALDGFAPPADDRHLTAALAEVLVTAGAGRQHLTVLAGVRRARRDPAAPWPPPDDHTLTAQGAR